MYYKILGLFIALGFAASSTAQWSVQGRVIDNDQEPLTGATITLKGASVAEVADADGYFTLENINRDSVVAEIRYIGYRTETRVIKQEQANQILIIRLKRAPVYTQEVQISATRAMEKTPMAYTDLDQEEIEEENSGRDVPYLVQNVPNTVAYSDAGAGVGYTGLRIRGSDITRINVTINGIPLNDSESQGVFWVNTPDIASSTQSIQIQRGVGTSTNGAGSFGATLNMETAGPKSDPFGALHISGGSFNTRRITAEAGTGLIDDHWWFEARGSRIKSDGYLDRASSDLDSYFLSGGYVDKKTSIKAVVFGGGETTYQAWYGVDSATFAEDPTFNPAGAIYDEEDNIERFYDNQTDNYKQDHYQLHWNQRINDRLKFNLSFHYTYGRGYYEEYRQDADFSTYGLEPVSIGGDTIRNTDLIRRLWLDNDFYGTVANIQYDSEDWRIVLGGAIHRYEGDHFGEITWARFASNSEIRDRFYDNDATKLDANGYVKAYYDIDDRFTAFGDLQVRTVDYTGDGIDMNVTEVDFDYNRLFFNPKAGLNFAINDRHSVYGSYAVAHKEPNRNDILAADPDDLPEPEQLQDVEVGYEYKSRKLSANVNGYFMYYKDQLVLSGEINDVGAFVRENVGRSYRAGVELSGAYAPTSELSIAPSVAWSRNINLDYKVSSGEEVEDLGETEIAFSPEWVASAEVKYMPVNGLSLEWTPRYVGEQYLSNENQEGNVLDAYFVNDFRVSYNIPVKLLDKLSVYVQGLNMLDEKYAANGYTAGGAPYYYPQAGRHFMAGLNARF